MDMRMLRDDWEALAGRRQAFIDRFYQRLFAEYPRYREMFPDDLGPQRERMIEMLCSVVRFADHADILRPYLVNVGHAHRRLGIDSADVENFTDTFIDTMGELCAPDWDERHVANWRLAFDELVVPLFDEGLEFHAQA